MTVILSPRTQKRLKKLPRFDQIAIIQKIQSLSGSGLSEEKLQGFSHIYRVMAGDYHIVYSRSRERIYVYLIGHRREIYQMLTQLLR